MTYILAGIIILTALVVWRVSHEFALIGEELDSL